MRTEINKKSDFDFIVLDSEGNAINMPSNDFTLDIWTWGSKCRFRASSIGGVLKGCNNDGGKLRVYVDNPGFVPGKLVGEWVSYISSEEYPDGTQRTCRYISDFGIDMVDGDSQINEVQVLAMMQYIQGASAYEIACEYGFEGTEQEWLDSLALPANEAAAECRTLITELSSAEAQRVANEDVRTANEETRVQQESARVSAEEQRTKAEANRRIAENTRDLVETTRQNAERNRDNAEAARVSAENTRKTAEDARIANESTRQANEQARVASETNRESAETNRANAEAARVEAEQARVEEFATFAATLAAKEDVANKVTSIGADADDVHYPSAKAVKDSLAKVKNIEVTPDMLSESTKQFINASGGGTITNFADDEDLTTVDNALKLADKTYDPITFSGMGRKYLRKNLVDGKNILTQEMMPSVNTIYIIQYDYDLNGATITIPENCVLEFRGGIFSNGNVRFANTYIAASSDFIFSNINFSGYYTNDDVKISWFTKGMSSTTDFSRNHAEMIKSAMQMATIMIKWVDLEKIPLLIRGELIVDETQGNCGLRNGQIYFISEKENDCTLRYVQTKVYSGAYSPIIDTTFRYVGDGSGNLHANVSCIYKDNWSDTQFTYWRDIRCVGYTGYFMVNTTYLQEVTFTNINLYDTFGFITYNTQGIWGETKGSSNIVKFFNCNLNGVAHRIKPYEAVTPKYIWDFYQPIEISLESIVNQGSISDEVGEEIIPIRIEGSHVIGSINNNVNCVLDGFWIEYTSGNVYKNIILENANIYLTLKKRNCLGVDARGTCRGTINFEHANVVEVPDFLENILIEDLENTRLSLIINASFKKGNAWFNLSDNTIDLIERGIIRVLNVGINNFREASVNINILPTYKFDVKKQAISEVKPYGFGNGRTRYITNENGITTLCCENNSEGGYSDITLIWDEDVRQHLFGRGIGKIDFVKEVIYRATLTVDVTVDNIDKIRCKLSGFTNPSEAISVDAITPEVGMKAGTTTGWVRNVYTGFSSYLKFTVDIRYAKVEIAKMVVTSGTVLFGSDDVLFDSDNKTIMRRNVAPETYYISVNSQNDNEAYMSSIIKSAPTQDLFVTDKNIYRWDGSKIKNVANNSGETSERPTNCDNGTSYYDTTLNKPIWWTGSAWVDATGATV